MRHECTIHNSIILALFVPKIVKFGGSLTELWQKQFWLFIWEMVYKQVQFAFDNLTPQTQSTPHRNV